MALLASNFYYKPWRDKGIGIFFLIFLYQAAVPEVSLPALTGCGGCLPLAAPLQCWHQRAVKPLGV